MRIPGMWHRCIFSSSGTDVIDSDSDFTTPTLPCEYSSGYSEWCNGNTNAFAAVPTIPLPNYVSSRPYLVRISLCVLLNLSTYLIYNPASPLDKCTKKV